MTFGPSSIPICLVAGWLTTPAAAVNTWLFEVNYSDPAGVINSLDDTARVTLWASFDENLYAFANSALNVAADDHLHAGVWSYIERLLKGPGSQDGTAMNGTVYDIRVGQIHFPGEIFADSSNPIRVWTAVWQTDDLHPRTIPLSTATTTYNLYISPDGTSKSFLDSLVEGGGEISVVPAPGAGVLFATGCLAAAPACRRRRSCRKASESTE